MYEWRNIGQRSSNLSFWLYQIYVRDKSIPFAQTFIAVKISKDTFC